MGCSVMEGFRMEVHALSNQGGRGPRVGPQGASSAYSAHLFGKSALGLRALTKQSRYSGRSPRSFNIG